MCRFKSHVEKSKPKPRIIEPCDEEEGYGLDPQNLWYLQLFQLETLKIKGLLCDAFHSGPTENSGAAVDSKELTDGKDTDSEVLDELGRQVQGVAAEIRALEQKIGAFLIQ